MPRDNTVFDVFAGGGGSSTAFVEAGFRCIGAIENNKDACDTYRANHADTPVLQKDVTTVTEREVLDLVSSGDRKRRASAFRVVIGSPPCQGFSLAGRTPSTPVATDSLWRYVIQIGRWLDADAIVIENVPNFLTKKSSSDGTTTIFQEVLRALEDAGYAEVQSRVLNALDFGVPQARRRAFIVATKVEGAYAFPYGGVKTASTYASVLQSKRDVQASIRKHGYDVYMSRPKIQYYVERKLQRDEYVRWVSRKNVPMTLRAGYMQSRGAEALVKYAADDAAKMTDDARVERADEVGAMRMLTIEECMAIQSFPSAYVFCGSVSSIYRQIGNAVPVGLARAVAWGFHPQIPGPGATRPRTPWLARE